MKLNFTAGFHNQIYWSHKIVPGDTTVNDGDDYYTRVNRTYLMCRAPWKADTFYLVVSYVKYDLDKMIEIYWEPDSLDSSGTWNRSTMGVHDEQAPDTYTLSINNYNFSLGYSFDFRFGYGQSSYGLNLWVAYNTTFNFYTYVNPDLVDMNDYLTLIVPLETTTDNVTFETSIYHVDIADPIKSHMEMMAETQTTNGFVVISMQDTILTNWTAGTQTNFTGWFWVSMQIKNDTRIQMPLIDTRYSNDTGYNDSWFYWAEDSITSEAGHHVWDSEYNYNPLDMMTISNESYTAVWHWRLFYEFTFNDYYYERTFPAPGGTGDEDEYAFREDMNFIEAYFYGAGVLFGFIGGIYTPINFAFGSAIRAAGLGLQLLMKSGIVGDFFGTIWDKVRGFFQDLGTWIWRIGQIIRGALFWFVETITYFGSIILGILIVVLALIILFVPMYATAVIASAMVKAAYGDVRGAMEDVGDLAAKGQTAIGKVTRRG